MLVTGFYGVTSIGNFKQFDNYILHHAAIFHSHKFNDSVESVGTDELQKHLYIL